jgi:hypothetical protein
MKFLILCLLTMSGAAFASSQIYDLSMDLFLNGKHVSSPKMILKEANKASVSQVSKENGTFIDVVASEVSAEKNKGILMKFVIGKIDNKGQKIILSTPQIVANENEKAEITVKANKAQPDTLTLTVTAIRK